METHEQVEFVAEEWKKAYAELEEKLKIVTFHRDTYDEERRDKSGQLIELKRKLGSVKYAAETITRLLELGDNRLMASDGPCGGQNAIDQLSVEESAELYQAAAKIAEL
jgi:hypothetical protein